MPLTGRWQSPRVLSPRTSPFARASKGNETPRLECKAHNTVAERSRLTSTVRPCCRTAAGRHSLPSSKQQQRRQATSTIPRLRVLRYKYPRPHRSFSSLFPSSSSSSTFKHSLHNFQQSSQLPTPTSKCLPTLRPPTPPWASTATPSASSCKLAVLRNASLQLLQLRRER